MRVGLFDLLTPDAVILAVERALNVTLDGSLQPYPSYVNRVYGVRDEEDCELVVKFYRPRRWSEDAILEEHRFLLDCAAAEIPVVTPLTDRQGRTLHALTVDPSEATAGAQTTARSDGVVRQGESFSFTVFPKRGGRSFDAETDEQWYRLGLLIGRCHVVGAQRRANHRLVCTPRALTGEFVDQLMSDGLVVGESREEFESICRDTLRAIEPLFDGVALTRIHGDCHRGNILDRPDSGLLLFDFDDMMIGPAVQDLWLLLPDYAANCRRELTMLLDGYQQFTAFDRASLRLIEPLRFMRMVYFLAWRAAQLHDHWFRRSFPDWGSEAFWIQETEDLKTQARMIVKGHEAW
ncbi:MAG: serine/threonine protein kinase [Spirochaetaceae bacterium]|nr:MAG: serine/threonine protein kinase [Spirochaetaceae bacterium]